MRVLYCNKYNYLFSGTEAYLFELIRRMEERGHDTASLPMKSLAIDSPTLSLVSICRTRADFTRALARSTYCSSSWRACHPAKNHTCSYIIPEPGRQLNSLVALYS